MQIRETEPSKVEFALSPKCCKIVAAGRLPTLLFPVSPARFEVSFKLSSTSNFWTSPWACE